MVAERTSSGGLSAPGKLVSAAPVFDHLVPGTGLGRWVVRQLLGQGATGQVYAADAVPPSVEPVPAALKLIRRSVDTDVVMRRFQLERRILSRLSHPNIAALLDAGITADGWPFLVMERVSGLPLDDWSRQHLLDARQIVTLMLQVCDAVQEAHRALIVHRDLKPSNVLVTASGRVKLLDFGVAKLLDDVGGAESARQPLTPMFAAPEQFRDDPVTLATDVHALGTLLYWLLCEQLPHDRSSPIAQRASARIDAPAPIAPSELLRMAASRGERIARRVAASTVAGELDRIILKALEQDPERRYPCARILGDELRQWVTRQQRREAHRSVSARVARYVHRHPVGLASAAAMFLSVTTGLSAAFWQLHEAAQMSGEQRWGEPELHVFDGQAPSGGLQSAWAPADFAVDPLRGMGHELTHRSAIEGEAGVRAGQTLSASGRVAHQPLVGPAPAAQPEPILFMREPDASRDVELPEAS